MTQSRGILLQEVTNFLRFRSAASFGKRFMKHNMRRSIIFSGAARKALHSAKFGRKKRKDPVWYSTLNPGTPGEGGFGKAKVNWEIKQGDKQLDYMRRTGKKLAPVVGGAVLGTAMAIRGVNAYRGWRKKVKQPTQYRRYDVYPEHGHAAVGIQPYNQPYYSDPKRSGPPRHQEANVGVYEREDFINDIVEALSNR